MQLFPHHEDRSPKPLAQRLDRAFANINAFLLALAIGLAILDTTCFVGTKYLEMMEHAPKWAQTTVAEQATVSQYAFSRRY